MVCGAVRRQHEPPTGGEVLIVLGVGDVETGSMCAPASVGTARIKIQEVFHHKRINDVR